MIRPFMYKIAVNIILALIAVSFAQGAVGREEFHVDSDPGVSLFIREVKARDAKPAPPILLIHGARVPGVGLILMSPVVRWLAILQSAGSRFM